MGRASPTRRRAAGGRSATTLRRLPTDAPIMKAKEKAKGCIIYEGL